MVRYILKRLLMLIPILVGVIIIIFTLKVITPGDPVDSLLDTNATEQQREDKREELGLNDPILVQFGNYIKGVIKGDLGNSYKTNSPVIQEIMPRLKVSLVLCIGSVILGLLIGLPLGVISALKKYTWIDSLVLTISMAFTSIPNFCIALVFIYIFSVILNLLPSSGITDIRGYILPMVVTGLGSMSSYTRITRSSMLEVLGQDYIRTARAKGQKESKITISHALRNSLIPIAASVGNQFGIQVGGALIIETVFGLPGVGKYVADAILARDYPSILGGVLILALLCTIINLIVDLSYMVIDPRLKQSLISSKTKKISQSFSVERSQ